MVVKRVTGLVCVCVCDVKRVTRLVCVCVCVCDVKRVTGLVCVCVCVMLRG